MTITGYYDGTAVRTDYQFQKNQRVIIIPIDDLSEDQSAAGDLREYANTLLIAQEKDAWRKAAIKKHEE